MIKLRPFVSAGEVLKLPDDPSPRVVPLQLFRIKNNIVLRVGDTTFWFDESGNYDGPEADCSDMTDAQRAEFVKLIGECAGNKGRAPATAYFEPGSNGHDAEVAGWPKPKASH